MIYRYLPFVLKLNSPAIVGAIGGGQGPSGTSSLSYIPGSVIRGIVAARLGDPESHPDRFRAFHTLVLGGQVRYLNAYPYCLGHRTLPRPLSLRSEKGGLYGAEEQVWDLAAFGEDNWPRESLQVPRFGYISFAAARPCGVSPSLGVHLHHQRDRKYGRPRKDHGTVFQYVFLKAGQSFVGNVCLCGQSEQEIDDLSERIKMLLKRPLMFGRSWHSGYGGNADIVWLEQQEREVIGESVIRNDISAGEVFRVILTSPCVIRSPATGQYDPSAFEAELLRRLSGRAEPVMRFYGFEIAGGFNKKWKTETTQALALSAGSVLLLRAKERIPLRDVKLLEHEGIGERLAEGYGRLSFLDEPASQMTVATEVTGEPVRPEGEPPELVRFIERRLLARALRRRAEETAARLVREASGTLPDTSLLGGLLVLLRAGSERGLQTLRERLLDEGPNRLRRPAVNQLKRCYLHVDRKRMSLLAWMKKMVEPPMASAESFATRSLQFQILAQRHFVISEDSALSHLSDMREQATEWLLECVLSGLAVRKRREAEEGA